MSGSEDDLEDQTSPESDEEIEEEESPGDDESSVDIGDQADDANILRLPAGAPLTAAQTESLRRRRRTRVIAFAGDIKSGKTTLLASIFLRFQNGPFANYLFAGSQTLMALEARCWPSRAASLGRKASTLRTPVGTRGFYHLRVRKLDLLLNDLLFFDISGETYEDAVKSASTCKGLHEIEQADHFVLLIDGAKLRSYTRRQLALSNARQLLRRLLDTNMLRSEAAVQVLFTKKDILNAEMVDLQNEDILPADDYCTASEAESFLKITQTTMEQEFKERVGSLVFFQVAARADLGGYELADGVDAVFPLWVEQLPNGSGIMAVPPKAKPEREVDKFLVREIGSDN